MIERKQESDKKDKFKTSGDNDRRPFMPLVDSKELFGGAKEIMIRHEGVIYRLRITRNDKLVMNK